MIDQLIIYTDGACKRNGKPDCISGFGVCITQGSVVRELSGYESASTSQRGELWAMYHALKYINEHVNEEVYVVSDSAYIVNCLRNEWYSLWEKTGWITSTGNPVKNRDIWELIAEQLKTIDEDMLHLYLIKGHLHLKDIEVGMQKFAEQNFGAALPQEVFEKMVVGNNEADLLAKHAVACGNDYLQGIEVRKLYTAVAAPQ